MWLQSRRPSSSTSMMASPPVVVADWEEVGCRDRRNEKTKAKGGGMSKTHRGDSHSERRPRRWMLSTRRRKNSIPPPSVCG